jgi:hypothetical protein
LPRGAPLHAARGHRGRRHTRVLRFYQLLGFRLLRVERDAFTPETGYPEIVVDGIPLRDRVWLSLTLNGESR